MSTEEPKATPIKDWDIHFKLVYIQSKLVAAKDLNNKFGNYTYRSNESIIQAVKPHLEDTGLVLLQEDEIVLIGDRYYIKATSYLLDCQADQQVKSTAYAREQQTKKGMDEAQITGAASSYARKYSLNGLFAIDDSKDDPDSKDNKKLQEQEKADKEKAKAIEFSQKVDDAIQRFIKTSNEYKTIAQWDSAIESISKNNNRVSKDPKFMNTIETLYHRVLKDGVEVDK